MRNEDLYSQIKDLIEAQNKGLKAEIKANHDMSQLQLSKIIERQDRTNGHVADNCAKIDSFEKQTRFIRWMHRNPAFAVVLIVFLVMGFLFAVINLGFETVLKLF